MFYIRYYETQCLRTCLFECVSPYLELDGSLVCFRDKTHKAIKYTDIRSVYFHDTLLNLGFIGEEQSFNSASL